LRRGVGAERRALASGLSSMPSIAERRCAPCAVRLQAELRLRHNVGAERRALASSLSSTPSIASRRFATCAVRRRAGSARDHRLLRGAVRWRAG